MDSIGVLFDRNMDVSAGTVRIFIEELYGIIEIIMSDIEAMEIGTGLGFFEARSLRNQLVPTDAAEIRQLRERFELLTPKGRLTAIEAATVAQMRLLMRSDDPQKG